MSFYLDFQLSMTILRYEISGIDSFILSYHLSSRDQALVSQVMTATKSVSGLPQEGDDYDYYASFPSYKTFCSKMVSRIDRIVSRVIRHQQLPCYWGVEQEGTVTEGSLLEEKLETLVEANDMLLERAVSFAAENQTKSFLSFGTLWATL